MNTKLYYTPPPDDQFDELKAAAIGLWSTMGSEPSYPKEKIGRIKDLANVSDNFMYMVAMFDVFNQAKLAERLSKETREAVRERLLAGGARSENVPF